jgi:hypothetical protein
MSEAPVRLGVVCAGASWIGQHVKSLLPHARQGLDSSHCTADLQRVAKAQYGASVQALAWVEATMTRLDVGQVGWVLGGLRRTQASSDAAEKAMAHGWDSLAAHRERTHDSTLRRGGYP